MTMLMVGNWVYSYEDSGGSGHIVAIEWTGGPVVQDSYGSKVISTSMIDPRFELQIPNTLILKTSE